MCVCVMVMINIRHIFVKGLLANVCVFQVESQTAQSELKLGNATGRLVQLEREAGLLRQNHLEVTGLAETANLVADQATVDAETAQKVT